MIISDKSPSHIALSSVKVTPSECYQVIVYERISEPPFHGASQVITTSDSDLAVNGVSGWSGG